MTSDKAELKAKELVNSFYQPLGLLHCNVSSNQMWEHAKQCAILAVDEMILEHHHYGYEDRKRFWVEVKISINKL